MTRDKKELLAGYVDGELTDEERREFEEEMRRNPDLRAEVEEFRRLKEVTSMVRYADLPDEVWQTYWESLYRKLERGIGWILFSLGAIIILAFGVFTALKAMYMDPLIPIWLKVGVGAGVLGLIFLLVSFLRERLFSFKKERYWEIDK